MLKLSSYPAFVALVLGFAASASGAAGVLDQRQELQTELNGVPVVGSQLGAQTFTAGLTGALNQVDVRLNRVGSPGTLTVEIRVVQSNVPTGTVLAAGSVSDASLDADPVTFQWVSVPLTPIPVVSGVQYAIVLRDAGGGAFPIDYFTWADFSGDAYTGGSALTSVDGGATWLFPNPPGADLTFRTYVLRLPEEIRVTGDTRLLADGDVIFLDFEGRGHRLRPNDPALAAQLVHYAGRRMTIVGTPVRDPNVVPNYPIHVTDFRLEPGGAFDGMRVTLSGETERLPDGDVIIRDEFGAGHRLRATGAIKAFLEETAGTHLTVFGPASVTNAASRVNWPIEVLSVLRVHASRSGCFAGPSSACFRVTGFGLKPNSDVVFLTVNTTAPSDLTVSSEGTADWTIAIGCSPPGERQVRVFFGAFATTALSTAIDAADTVFCADDI